MRVSSASPFLHLSPFFYPHQKGASPFALPPLSSPATKNAELSTSAQRASIAGTGRSLQALRGGRGRGGPPFSRPALPPSSSQTPDVRCKSHVSSFLPLKPRRGPQRKCPPSQLLSICHLRGQATLRAHRSRGRWLGKEEGARGSFLPPSRRALLQTSRKAVQLFL